MLTIFQKNVRIDIQRLAADPCGDPLFEISLEAKTQDELLQILKDAIIEKVCLSVIQKI